MYLDLESKMKTQWRLAHRYVGCASEKDSSMRIIILWSAHSLNQPTSQPASVEEWKISANLSFVPNHHRSCAKRIGCENSRSHLFAAQCEIEWYKEQPDVAAAIECCA